MSTKKVAEPMRLRTRLHRAGDDSFKIISSLNFQGAHHRVRGLADGDYEHAIVRVKIVKVLGNAQHPALARNMALESSIDAGFAQRAFEKMPRQNPHLNGNSFAVTRRRRHGRIIEAICLYQRSRGDSRPRLSGRA